MALPSVTFGVIDFFDINTTVAQVEEPKEVTYRRLKKSIMKVFSKQKRPNKIFMKRVKRMDKNPLYNEMPRWQKNNICGMQEPKERYRAKRDWLVKAGTKRKRPKKNDGRDMSTAPPSKIAKDHRICQV